MSDREIEQKIREIIAQKFSVPLDDIRPESRLIEDLKVDSFGALEIMFEIEEAFGLSIPDSDISRVRSVQDITRYVSEWLQKKNPTSSAADSTPGTTGNPGS